MSAMLINAYVIQPPRKRKTRAKTNKKSNSALARKRERTTEGSERIDSRVWTVEKESRETANEQNNAYDEQRANKERVLYRGKNEMQRTAQAEEKEHE